MVCHGPNAGWLLIRTLPGKTRPRASTFVSKLKVSDVEASFTLELGQNGSVSAFDDCLAVVEGH